MSLTEQEQDAARRALAEAGVRFRDEGYGFFVYGQIGHYLAPAEVLVRATRGWLR